MSTASASRKSRRLRKAEPAWTSRADDELLKTPLKALKLSLNGSWLADCLDQLNQELRDRNILLRVHGWISEEWFSPQNIPGIAFPFYLAHPRLVRLERKMMLEVEGGARRDCMRILRHEAGHVIQYGYGLHRRRRWQRFFGRASKPYPDQYRADPSSKNYVQYLRRWYAQCHPDEDFAETFAVWLTPRSNWRKQYADWPALQKLIYVDELMCELAGENPLPRKRIEIDPLSKLGETLEEHYQKKRKRYAVERPTIFDRDLRRIFASDDSHRRAPLAAALIRKNRAQIIRAVSRSTGEYPVALDAALDDMIDRCRALKLRAPGARSKARLEVTAMLSSKAVSSHYSALRHHWFAV